VLGERHWIEARRTQACATSEVWAKANSVKHKGNFLLKPHLWMFGIAMKTKHPMWTRKGVMAISRGRCRKNGSHARKGKTSPNEACHGKAYRNHDWHLASPARRQHMLPWTRKRCNGDFAWEVSPKQ